MDLLDDELNLENKRKDLIHNYNEAYKLYHKLITKYIKKNKSESDLNYKKQREYYLIGTFEKINEWSSIDIIKKFRDCDYDRYRPEEHYLVFKIRKIR